MLCLMQRFDSYEEDVFQSGKSKRWTFFNCTPGEMTIEIKKSEHYYLLEGQCSLTFAGERCSHS